MYSHTLKAWLLKMKRIKKMDDQGGIRMEGTRKEWISAKIDLYFSMLSKQVDYLNYAVMHRLNDEFARRTFYIYNERCSVYIECAYDAEVITKEEYLFLIRCIYWLDDMRIN